MQLKFLIKFKKIKINLIIVTILKNFFYKKLSQTQKNILKPNNSFVKIYINN